MTLNPRRKPLHGWRPWQEEGWTSPDLHCLERRHWGQDNPLDQVQPWEIKRHPIKRGPGSAQCAKDCGPHNHESEYRHVCLCQFLHSSSCILMFMPHFFNFYCWRIDSTNKTCKQNFGITIFYYEGHNTWPLSRNFCKYQSYIKREDILMDFLVTMMQISSILPVNIQQFPLLVKFLTKVLQVLASWI